MKILLTGAHFTPAMAVIEELKKKPFKLDLVYVGRQTTQEGDSTKSQESRVLPSLGAKFIPIITGRWQRSFTLYTIPSLLKIPIGFIQAVYIILSQKPDVILSFGGYVAVPVVFAGWLFSIPIMVHEQTLVIGLANKISALFADKIALSFEENHNKGEKTILTGNPLRQEILNPVRKLSGDFVRLFRISKEERIPVIMIMGGNQGAHIINKTVEEILNQLTKLACVIHLTGDNKFNDFERLQKLRELKELGGRYLIKKWIGEEMGAVLSKADLVISRAGANTLTELSFLGKPALVIPIPYLYQDEQTKNARFFQNLGLVKVLPQAQLSSSSLLENIRKMLKNLNNLKQKAKYAKKIIIPDAAKRLALETILLVSN